MAQNAVATVRMTALERDALDELAARCGLSKSELLRLGMHAVLIDPGAVLGLVSREGTVPPKLTPPARPKKRQRRRR